MRIKNQTWLREVHKKKYKNQKYLEETKRNRRKTKHILYGLEAESISEKRLTIELERVMVPLIGKNEALLKIYELKKLNKSLTDLILHLIS